MHDVLETSPRSRPDGSSGRTCRRGGSATRGGSGSISHGCTVKTAGRPARFARAIDFSTRRRRAHTQAPAPAHAASPDRTGRRRTAEPRRSRRAASTAREGCVDSRRRPTSRTGAMLASVVKPLPREHLERPRRPVVDRPFGRAKGRWPRRAGGDDGRAAGVAGRRANSSGVSSKTLRCR